jgi:hypothetical protein
LRDKSDSSLYKPRFGDNETKRLEEVAKKANTGENDLGKSLQLYRVTY